MSTPLRPHSWWVHKAWLGWWSPDFLASVLGWCCIPRFDSSENLRKTLICEKDTGIIITRRLHGPSLWDRLLLRDQLLLLPAGNKCSSEESGIPRADFNSSSPFLVEICENGPTTLLSASSSRIIPRCDRGDHHRKTTCWASYDFFMGTSKCHPVESSPPSNEWST